MTPLPIFYSCIASKDLTRRPLLPQDSEHSQVHHSSNDRTNLSHKMLFLADKSPYCKDGSLFVSCTLLVLILHQRCWGQFLVPYSVIAHLCLTLYAVASWPVWRVEQRENVKDHSLVSLKDMQSWLQQHDSLLHRRWQATEIMNFAGMASSVYFLRIQILRICQTLKMMSWLQTQYTMGPHCWTKLEPISQQIFKDWKSLKQS